MTVQQVYEAAWLLAPVLAGLLVAVRPVGRRRLSVFARSYGVVVDAENGPPLLRYLGRGRRYRSVGGVLGWCAGVVAVVVQDARPEVVAGGGLGSSVIGGVAGYLAGALAAELRVPVAIPAGRRRAALAVRRPEDYLTPTARITSPAVAAAALLVLLAAALWPAGPATGTAVLVAVAVALAAVVRIAQRRIAERPRPPLPPAARGADDAVRASAAQVITGAGAALACAALSGAAGGIDPAAAPGPLAGVIRWAPTVLGFLTLGSWFVLRASARPLPGERPAEA